jgi:hypothetical protein
VFSSTFAWNESFEFGRGKVVVLSVSQIRRIFYFMIELADVDAGNITTKTVFLTFSYNITIDILST